MGDWYLWHAPDGPGARAATGLGCMQARAQKLGVIEASYASAIIDVPSPVSSAIDGIETPDNPSAPEGSAWPELLVRVVTVGSGVSCWHGLL